MEKKPKLSFQRGVGTQVKDAEPIQQFEPVEKKIEYQSQEQQTQLEINTENYIDAFIYFSNLCKEKGLPSEYVMVLWNLFIGPAK